MFFKYNEYIEYLVEVMKKWNWKIKKAIAKIHGIGTFVQYVQIKNCWEELQLKTVAALRDKLFGYVLKRPMYPIGPIVTQPGNLSKNGLLFDWLNK